MSDYKGRGSTGWMLVIAIEILTFIVMSFALVWSNIEMMDINYKMSNLYSQLNEKQAIKEKLEIESEHLLSPYVLGLKAKEFGMKQPEFKQVRRIK